MLIKFGTKYYANDSICGNCMMNFKDKIAHHVIKFKRWRSDNYSLSDIQRNICDDPSYPDWPEIDDLFENLVFFNAFDALTDEDLTNLLYLIARNWDIGTMINWYSETLPIHSGKVDLRMQDFIKLALVATELSLAEYDDAKSQIAACFRKFDNLTSEMEEILLRLFADPNEYTKRQALFSLVKLKYKDVNYLAEKYLSDVAPNERFDISKHL